MQLLNHKGSGYNGRQKLLTNHLIILHCYRRGFCPR